MSNEESINDIIKSIAHYLVMLGYTADDKAEIALLFASILGSSETNIVLDVL